MKKIRNIVLIMLAILSSFSVCYADVVGPIIDSNGNIIGNISPKDHSRGYFGINSSEMIIRLIVFFIILLAIGFCVYKIINKIIKNKKNNDKK